MNDDTMPLGRRSRTAVADPDPDLDSPQNDREPVATPEDIVPPVDDPEPDRSPKAVFRRLREQARQARQAERVKWWAQRPEALRDVMEFRDSGAYKIETAVPAVNGAWTAIYWLFLTLYAMPATLIGNGVTYAHQRIARAIAFWVLFWIFSRATGLEISFGNDK